MFLTGNNAAVIDSTDSIDSRTEENGGQKGLKRPGNTSYCEEESKAKCAKGNVYFLLILFVIVVF